ncbi:hypothetical protein JOM56_006358 [Amanita muscaria]
MLSPPRKRLDLELATVEEICLASCKGNYNFGEMKLGYECLDVPISSGNILKEMEFIDATSRISSFNVLSCPILPIEIRLTKDWLSLVSRALSSTDESYEHTEVILELLGYVGVWGRR